MRLNLYRSGGTKRYNDQGEAIWYVVDESAPGEQKYSALFNGNIVECARFILEQEQAVRCDNCGGSDITQADHETWCPRFDGEQASAQAREQEWVEASEHPSYHSNVDYQYGAPEWHGNVEGGN